MVTFKIRKLVHLNAKIILLFIINPFLQYSSFAETLIFKSGQKIECKKKGENSKYIIIDFQGKTLTYSRDDILSIDGVYVPTEAEVMSSDKRRYQSLQDPYQVLQGKIDAAEYLREGTIAALNNELDRAISKLSKGLELDPDNDVGWDQMGYVWYMKFQESNESDYLGIAMNAYDKAIAINPNEPSHYCHRGMVFFVSGNLAQAMLDYDKAIQKGQNKDNESIAEAYYQRAIAYFAMGEYDKSWQDLHKAEELGWGVAPAFLEALKNKSGRDR